MFWFQKPDFWAFYSPELLSDARHSVVRGLKWFEANHSALVTIQSQSEHFKQSEFLGVSYCKSATCERNPI
jgi:hypothetical protein